MSGCPGFDKYLERQLILLSGILYVEWKETETHGRL